jgi:thiol-disulfide isomerase/thioredoxin
MPLRCILVCLLVACGTKTKVEEERAPADSELAWQRVVLFGADASEVTFVLGIPRDETGKIAVVVSGTQRALGKVTRAPAKVRVDFPIYTSALVLDAASDGSYTGRFEATRPKVGYLQMPLKATPIAGPTIAAQATLQDGKPLDLGEPLTIWRMKLGELGVKLLLQQQAVGEFAATMYFENGNVVYFSGTGRDDRLLLAGFEGASPFSLDLTFDSARKLAKGVWRAGNVLGWKEAISGERTTEFPLASKITIESKRAVLTHAKLRGTEGKPLIVELGATWCASCKRVAPALRSLYEQHKSHGLQVVTLLYELSTDPAYNKQAEVLFRQAHHVPWPVYAVPGGSDDIADNLPEGLRDVDIGGLPVVVFRRRDGTIAGVNAGFPAESTGAPHQATIAKFERLAAEIVQP